MRRTVIQIGLTALACFTVSSVAGFLLLPRGTANKDDVAPGPSRAAIEAMLAQDSLSQFSNQSMGDSIAGSEPEPGASGLPIADVSAARPQDTQMLPSQPVGGEPQTFNQKLGQQYFEQEAPAKALPYLKQSRDAADPRGDAKLLFQIGLCHEYTGSLDQAVSVFGELERCGLPVFEEAGQLSLARCYLKLGDLPRAESMLWKLNAGLKGGGRFAAEEKYLLGNLIGRQLVDTFFAYETSSLRLITTDLPFRYYDFAQNVLSYKEKKPAVDDQADSPTRGPWEFSNVIKSGPTAEELFFDIRVRKNNFEVLKALSVLLEVPIRVSEEAELRLMRRITPLTTRATNLAFVLDLFSALNELVWFPNEDGITMLTRSESTRNQWQHYRLGAARRLLMDAILETSENDLTVPSEILLASLYFLGGDSRAAISTLETVLQRDAMESHLRPVANMNLGVVLARNGQINDAISTVQLVADDSVPSDVLTRANETLGYLHLENGETQNAVIAYSRARRLSEDTFEHHELALHLAASYFLDGNPAAAIKTISEHPRYSEYPDLLPAARTLLAASRFQLAASAAQRESSLLDVFGSVDDAEMAVRWGPHHLLIVTETLADVGFHAEVNRLIEQAAAEQAYTWLGFRLRRQWVQSLIAESELERVREIFQQQFYDPRIEDSSRMLLDWARMELAQEDYAECKRICNFLLEQTTASEITREALSMMGKIHESQGDYRTAAIYFAGIAPKLESTEVDP